MAAGDAVADEMDARRGWRAFPRQWARPAIIHAREVVPYGKSPAERARVNAARAAQRHDAADRANLRPAHVHIDRDVYAERRNVHIRAAGNSRAAFLLPQGQICLAGRY